MRYSNSFIRLLLIGALLLSALVGCHSRGEAPAMSGPSTTPVSALIAALPIVDAVAFIPADPQVGEDVRAVVTTGYSRQRFEFRYEWLKNGAPVAAIDGDVFPGSQASVGDVLKVRVTPYDSKGDKKAYLSPYVVIRSRSQSTLRGDGHPCKKDEQCASGSCGIGDGGMRCIGNAPNTHQDLALNAEAIGRLEAETTLRLQVQQVPPLLPIKRAHGKRRWMASKNRHRTTGWRSTNDWDSNGSWSSSNENRSSPTRTSSSYASFSEGRASSRASSGLGVGASCTPGASCGAGLVCKGISGMSTCAPSGR